jgi:N-acetylglutamate synthase
MVGTIEFMCEVRPEAWFRRGDGFLVGATGVPMPTLNGVVCWDPEADLDAISASLAEVAATGLPHSILFRPDAEGFREAASGAGLERGDDVRLMRLDAEPEADSVARLMLRLLEPGEIATHVRVAAEGFEAPQELFDDLCRGLSDSESMLTLVGEVDGEPVTTAVGLLQQESVAVFNVATPPAYRGRGYGAAVTAAIVGEGRRRGARWAWLQPSGMGYAVYERLGFRLVGAYECWTSVAQG